VGGVIEMLAPTTGDPSRVVTRQDVLPTALRTPAVLLATGCAAVLAVLAFLVAGTATATPFDAWVERVIATHRTLHGWWTGWAIVVGEPATVIGCAVLLAGWCLRTGRRPLAAVVVLGPGLTGLAETVLKPLVGRTIADGSLAFPSGHTAGATALGLVAAIVVAAVVRERRAAWLCGLAAVTVVVAGMVALGLVGEHAHYPTDTIGGSCMAVVVTVLTVLGVDAVAARRAAVL
jgi:undecaprenyl-diphosphatase